jgi:hypothetical protein
VLTVEQKKRTVGIDRSREEEGMKKYSGSDIEKTLTLPHPTGI